jgi:uncharacterized low-complexity protein
MFRKSNPAAAAACMVFATSLAGMAIADPSASPFAMTSADSERLLMAEGKCGEGKCGMRRMDANGDGKVTKEEFMQGHDAMFDAMDTNGDGVIDAEEQRGHGHQGKCRMHQGS